MVALPRLPHCHNPKPIMGIVPKDIATFDSLATATTATLKIDFSEHCHDCHDCHRVDQVMFARASTAARLPRLPRGSGVLGIDFRGDCHDCHGARRAAVQARRNTVRGRVSGAGQGRWRIPGGVYPIDRRRRVFGNEGPANSDIFFLHKKTMHRILSAWT